MGIVNKIKTLLADGDIYAGAAHYYPLTRFVSEENFTRNVKLNPIEESFIHTKGYMKSNCCMYISPKRAMDLWHKAKGAW